MYPERRVVLTGGFGFLGSNLARRLVQAGQPVVVIDPVDGPAFPIPDGPGKLTHLKASIAPLDGVRTALKAANVVVHLAAIANPRTCEERPDVAWTVNVEGTREVLAATPDGARFILLSSAAVYGDPMYVPIDEGHPLRGMDRYASTKKAAEELCLAEASRLQVSVVRNFNTYGPGQSPSYLIPQLIDQGLREKRIEVWNTTPVRDYTYVDDTIAALYSLIMAEDGVPSVVNLGSGTGHSVADLAKSISGCLGNIPVTDLKRPINGSRRLVADNSRAGAALGWRPSVELAEGLKRTLDWYRGAR